MPSMEIPFQSTLPLRGVTAARQRVHARIFISIHTPLAGSDERGHDLDRSEPISIHTPLAGSDSAAFISVPSLSIFQSTLPLRGVTESFDERVVVVDISIHTPLAGSDLPPMTRAICGHISIHTPLAGSDRRNETFLTK